MVRNRIGQKIGRLHVITADDDGGRPFRSHAGQALLAVRGGADTIQYRTKRGDMGRMIADGLEVRQVCRRFGVTFLVNDRVDLCMALDADGVHLGKEDMPVETARRLLGSRKIIGATVRNAEDLLAAQRASADYVGCGPVFATSTKELPVEPLGIEGLRRVAAAAGIPVIAIAGIAPDNVADVIRAGAFGAAVVGAVVRAENPEAAARLLRDRIDAAKG